MNALLIVVSLVTLLSAMPASGQVDFATYDVDGLTQDDSRLSKLLSCILDETPCADEEQNIRVSLRDFYRSSCDGCSQAQKDQIKKLFLFIIKNKSAEWQKLVDKYDPSGERRQAWRDILAI